MATVMDTVQIGFLLVSLFNPGLGKLTITSTPFECGQSASIVCSRLDETVELISWYMNGIAILRCDMYACRYPTVGKYKFTADGGVWTITIDPVEWKDNNITFTCEIYNPSIVVPVRVPHTIDVSGTARPLHKTEQNVTFYQRVGDDITLNLTLVSYPLPSPELIQWTRVHKEQNITRFNESIVNLSDSSLESSLTLKDIQEGDFGQYKLTIRYNNTMEAFAQYFFINAQDKPQVPELFVHLDERITPTTAVLKWTPGFNGGVRQEFNILYKKASDSIWSHIVVFNSTLTLTGLDPSTLYNVYVFASNELGNSSRTVTLNVTTKPAIEDSQSPNNAAIIGGAAGASTVILLVVAVVLLVVFIRRLAANKSRQSADSQRRKVDGHDLDDPTTGTHGHSGTNEYYNTSRDTYDELQTCSSSSPYEDLNPSSTTEHAYGTLNRNNDEITPALPTSSTYENLRLTPFK